MFSRPRTTGRSNLKSSAGTSAHTGPLTLPHVKPAVPTRQSSTVSPTLVSARKATIVSPRPAVAENTQAVRTSFRIALFSAKPYDRRNFSREVSASTAQVGVTIDYHDVSLSPSTAQLATGADAVCIFVNDDGSAASLRALHAVGVRMVLLRCAGFDRVDLACARELEMPVMRVPRYSPAAIGEHAVALIMALTRRIPLAYNRVRQFNFSLEGLQGFDVCRKTVGIVGTGATGRVAAQIMTGFGSEVLMYDPFPDNALAARLSSFGRASYVPLNEVLERSDIISLHVPLSPATKHMIDAGTIAKMKTGVMLINTSRGGLLDTAAVVEALVSRKIGYLGIDVYENESEYFFEDRSQDMMADPLLARLVTFPNVVITAHQAFMTDEAMLSIARVTLENVETFLGGHAQGHANELAFNKSA
uniref:Mitochondrial D-lactate dehydrogenase n=1 Tax=Mastigamoeba balamuthi TaxID=108607 RepID=A0A0B4R364_MASBA|nr:mitochondrial D-lactate dehydrogenase [Mastigamoeba balamuthi]